MSDKKTKVLRVHSRHGTFRRAGHVFGPKHVDLPLSSLKEGVQERIEKEAELVAVVVEVDAEGTDYTAAAPAAAPAKKGRGK
jgi:hypothetical protein